MLSIAGDFDPAEARALVEQFFGPIPRGAGKPPLAPMSLPAHFGSWKREVVPDDVMLPRLFLAFRAPVFGSDEYYAACVLAAVLGPATAAACSARSCASARSRPKHPRSPSISRRARPARRRRHGAPGHQRRSSSSRKSCTRSIACARRRDDAEVQRAVALIETALVSSLQSAGDRADKLSMFATYFGDPALVNEQTARYQRRHGRAGERVRAAKLGPRQSRQPPVRAGRVDGGRSRECRKSASRSEHRVDAQPRPHDAPAGGTAARLPLPALRARRRSTTGSASSSRRCTSCRSCRRRSSSTPARRRIRRARGHGATRRACCSRERASERRRAHRAVRAVGRVGRRVRRLGRGDVTMTVLAPRLGEAFELLGEVLRAPAFPAARVSRDQSGASRGAAAAARRAARARRRAVRALRLRHSRRATRGPEHGDERSVTVDRSRGDRGAFIRRATVPRGVDAHPRRRHQRDRWGRARAAAARRLVGRGGAGDAGERRARARDARRAHRRKDDAPQSEIRVGHVGLPRNHPDFFPALIVNAVLGGLFNSRINLNLREVHGYTYGALRRSIGARRRGRSSCPRR